MASRAWNPWGPVHLLTHTSPEVISVCHVAEIRTSAEVAPHSVLTCLVTTTILDWTLIYIWKHQYITPFIRIVIVCTIDVNTHQLTLFDLIALVHIMRNAVFHLKLLGRRWTNIYCQSTNTCAPLDPITWVRNQICCIEDGILALSVRKMITIVNLVTPSHNFRLNTL